MKKLKNPSNRNSLPSIIISKFDSSKIYEIKVKYEKLARLDRLEIGDMSLDENLNILFKKVNFNGIDLEILNPLLLDFDSYTISGKLQKNSTNKTILTLKKDGKIIKYNVLEKDNKYFKNGKEFVIPKDVKEEGKRLVNDKFLLTIEDKKREENSLPKKRKKETQRDILKDETIEIYKRISSNSNIKSEDIYRIKRYMLFRSDMMFFYTFIDNFFYCLYKNKNEQLWNTNFKEKENLGKFIEFTLNDTLKNPRNGILKSYSKDLKVVQEDFVKIKDIFEKIRHALAHFDFTFIDNLLSNNIEFDFNIKLLNIVIEDSQDLYYEAKKEFIEDEKMDILDEKDISIKKLYTFYSKIDIKKPAFNKLINSFLIKDGVENSKLKEYIKEKYNCHYFIDIHDNKEYKKIYNEHKKLISENQNLQLNSKENGQKIKINNDRLEELKGKMNELTKANSLKRLEFKLRLAFGFIKVEYNIFKDFKNNFSEDIKKDMNIDLEKIKSYLDTSYSNNQFFNYKVYNKKTKQKDIDKDIFDDIEKETLKELVENDSLLKIILLFYIFTPKELKGEFLGFIKKFYHDTKNIDKDTKDKEEPLEQIKQEVPLKLKILEKNLTILTIFNYSISLNIEYDKNNNSFYERGNKFKKIYKDLKISHNQEEFDKSLLAPLLKYYMNLYKLLNDFEIYLLLKYKNKDNLNKESLNKLINDEQLKHNDHYNFTTLLSEYFNFDPKKNKKYETLTILRNSISHQKIDNLIYNLDKNKILEQRVKIVELIKEQRDIKETLKFDPINDFTMKTVQLLKSLENQSEKRDKIEEILKQQDLSANDFYNIYKLKGVESIKKELFIRLGKTKIEEKIQEDIAKGSI
ncbi:hypothetical protein CRV08_11245 [Halarcobacter ebronensis]|uniref:Uncharacterized protein n=1 Tax=Halarcobacter ebronensis TaxID=1462615 RepID=A0A4Q0YDL8_9BACT|nr:type VI-C CRISPR-associated RNA-guided ribonuclease Cas13c [Halarcobacter ebronensis]RXJ67159.1 hypothetical protein CRV08_11245 [Halarcobacter ebronensis]